MNPFVNTQQRSIELPFACKDLADVLRNTNQEPGSKARWKLLNGLQEAERYLAGLLLRPEALLYVSIDLDPPHSPHRLQLIPMRGQLCILLSIDGSDKGRLPRVRRFLRDSGISPIVDVLSTLSTTGMISSRVLVYPLPVVAPDAAELIRRVIREGFEIGEEAPLYVTSNEQTIA